MLKSFQSLMQCILGHDYVADLKIIAVLLQHLLHCKIEHRFLKAVREQTSVWTKENINVINQLANSPSEGMLSNYLTTDAGDGTVM